MLFRSLAVLFLSLGVHAAQASEAHYWILGSFKAQKNAIESAKALSDKLDGEVMIAKFSTDIGKRYRILTAYSDVTTKERLAELKIDAWALWLDLPTKDKPPQLNRQTDMAPSPSAMPHVAKPVTKSVAGPRAGESLQEFCLNRAGGEQRAKFCQDKRYSALATKQAMFKRKGAQEQILFCASEANRQQRENLCQNLGSR